MFQVYVVFIECLRSVKGGLVCGSKMEDFIGVKYKLKSSDNFDDYLKFIGELFIINQTKNR